MQEFSSISVSSYEAASLAAQLTEQSSQGWEVVAIVPTGSTITAYLSRAAQEGATAEPAAGGEATDGEATPAFAPSAPAAAAADAAGAGTTTPTLPAGDAAGSVAAADKPLSEVAPSEITGTDAPTVPPARRDERDELAALAASLSDAEPAAATTPTTTATNTPTNTAADTAADTGASAAAATTSATTSAAAAPAGWYADPSSRYELRYWDGQAWTEHVSRGGQQHTDPPVA